MKLLALHKPIKKPPRSDERDGELFCGTAVSAFSIQIAGSGGAGNVFLCAYEPTTGRNVTTVSGYSTTSPVITLSDYTMQRLAYGTAPGGYPITVVAKRDGVLHVGNNTYNMTNGQSLTVSAYGYTSSAAIVSGWFE